mgnify:FL=1
MKLKSTRLSEGKVENFAGGGVLTYFEDRKYPVHGYPTEEGIMLADFLKKYIISYAKFVSKKKGRALLSLLFFKKDLLDWLKEFSRFTASVDEKYLIPNRLSPAVKAFFDSAMSCWGNLFWREKIIEHNKDIKESGSVVYMFVGDDGTPVGEEYLYSWSWEDLTILTFCVILEEDKYYRWIFQDLMMNVRKWELVKNPAKEVLRIINLFLEREHRPAYKNLGWAIKLFLWTQPFLRKAISDFARQMDFSKFNMDRYDLWGALNSQVANDYSYTYSFNGWTKEEMLENYQKL